MFPLPFGFLTSFSQPLDPDAAAFLSAAGISNQVQSNAINNLVIDLKEEALWTMMDAIYPVVGGTAASHKLNLKDPRDLDAAFRLTFNGSWTHNSSGMKVATISTSNYANTYLTPSVTLSATSNSQTVYYTVPGNTTNGFSTSHGVADTSPVEELTLELNSVASRNDLALISDGTLTFANGALIVGTRFSNTSLKLKRAFDNVSFATAATNTDAGGNLPAFPYYINATNIDNTSRIASGDGTIGFFALGDGLSDAKSDQFSTIIVKYQTALGRNYALTDANANAFITATAITDTTEKSAVQQLAFSLKQQLLWSAMKAIYPMVGGTSTTCKFNLVDSRDLDAAYRLQFFGGWTFSANGAQPNGTNANADTFYNPFVQGVPTSSSLSYYSRTNISAAEAEMGAIVGALRWSLIIKYFGTFQSQFNNTTTGAANVAMGSTSLGLFMGDRISTTVHKGFRQGVEIISNTQTMTDANPNTNVALASFDTIYSSKQCAFAHIGSGLGTAGSASFNTIVQTFNTTLGRAV